MGFSLPLPQVVPDVGPGGPVVTAMRGANALLNDIYGTQKAGVEAQYAPLTVPAQALSQLAYANLMGPQFVAKALENPNILASTPEEQKNAARDLIYRAGTGQGTGNAILMSLIPLLQASKRPPSLLESLFTNVRNALFGAPQQQNQPAQQNQNAMIEKQSPIQNAQAQQTQAVQPNQNVTQSMSSSKGSGYSNQNTWAENRANQENIVKEGEELGKARGTAIADLGKQYVQDVEAMKPLERLAQLAQDPVFMNMRKEIPLFQDLQLQGLSKIGNPTQQKLIGDFIVDTKSAIANTVGSFSGRTMAREFDFANTMKVSDNDTLRVILGKLESLMTFKSSTMIRNKIARNLMKEKHMDEGDAYEEANKQVNMDEIRNNIAEKLTSPVLIKNTKTGKDMLITTKQYNELLKAKEKKSNNKGEKYAISFKS